MWIYWRPRQSAEMPSASVAIQRQTVSIQFYQQQWQQCTLFCHGLKNFSAKEMSDVTSYTDKAYIEWLGGNS